MDRKAIDAEVRELRDAVRRSPACARIRKNHRGYSMEVVWRLGVSMVRFQKTLATSHRGGDATVRTIAVEKVKDGFRVRALTTHDLFQRSSVEDAHTETAEGVQHFESLERALERVEQMVSEG